ncbi:glycoside hydrolase family protein [Bifidobacterium cebidarum]|uniref:beta-fructofuranosidase n=1 Tax=Bifidobacterium cebidarum TaxID=2650773 RepID=A0A6I1G7I2_9BIFI|nr:glycoside hydrolase family 32 protein [Bifidobacterium cebidarum]KAB7786456.1 Glycosyl hydrolase family 32 N-terminal domain-containing protein [Bifidobacterium cebidarum]
MTMTINADGYTTIEIFAEYSGIDGDPGTIRLTPLSSDTSAVTVCMSAAERRSRLILAINPEEKYVLESDNLKIDFGYLTGGKDLLDRGIRIITTDTRISGHRPNAHFEPAQHWMNDPNGLCRFQGRYHMFYQFNPYGWQWDDMHWGHAVSKDLIHWIDLPIALLPQPELSRDKALTGGAFSGSAITTDSKGHIVPGDEADVLRIYLTRHWARLGHPESVVETQTTTISTDGLTFGPETIVIERPSTETGLDFRDPKIDTTLFDGTAVAGTPAIVVATNMPSTCAPELGAPGTTPRPHDDNYWFGAEPFSASQQESADFSRTPTLALFQATDANLNKARWEYTGPLLFETGLAESYTYECPDIFTLDRSAVAVGSLMHLHDDSGRFQPIRWYTGTLETTSVQNSPKLVVSHTGWCDFGSCYYAVQSFRDQHRGADGTFINRRIAIGWLCDWYGVRIERDDYANGAMGLPRELHVVDGHLTSHPIDEVYELLLGEEIHLIPMSNSPVPEYSDSCNQDFDAHALIPSHAYYADIRPDPGTSFETILVSGQRRQPDGTTADASLHLSSDGSAVHLTTTGLPTDGFNYTSKTNRIDRIEVFYDHGITEVFVNNGEDAGSILFDCDEFDSPDFATEFSVRELSGSIALRGLRSIR